MNELETHEENKEAGAEPRKTNTFSDFLKFLIIALLIVVPVRIFVAQPFIVEGPSMQPTFQTGNYLIVDELSYRFENPQRGDIVILHNPANPSMFLIKRIIGLPGDTINISDGKVTIKSKADPKGTTLNEPYVKDPSHDFYARTLKDEYFVMGDNRAESLDSRILGPVPRDLIVGRALFRLLPINELSLLPGEFHP